MSKDWRARTLTHDVKVDQIIRVLHKYGIGKEILPTEMGGEVNLQNHLEEWIANRRAAEMEEI